MNHLVFLTPNTREPFTTSDVIAEFAGVQHHTVTRLIQQHEADFREFGLLRFQIDAVKREGARGTKYTKHYQLNEEQATLLMTYLKNTAQVRAFKKELVRQFYAMRTELYKVQMAKASRRPVRVSMTDAIKALPDSPHKALKYGQYTDLAYKLALGRTARQLRKDRGADKRATASDYMTAEEISLVAEVENKIGVLIGIGMSYQQVKASLTRNLNA